MAKFIPTAVLAAYDSIGALNDNFDRISDEFDNCVSRDGTAPNSMLSDLDLNHFTIENVAEGVLGSDAVNVAQLANALSGFVSVPNAAFPATSTVALAGFSDITLPAILGESGKEGIFVYDSSNLTAQVTADPTQLNYIPPLTDPTGASGAWVRKLDATLGLNTGASLVGFNNSLTYVAGSVGAYLKSLLASAGSALVGFIQSGTGAVSRTVQDKLRDMVHIKDFGAVSDGTTADTAAIQAAIDAVSAAGGGTVLIPAGSTRTGTLNRPENVIIQGKGKYASRLVATAGLNAPVIQTLGVLATPINRGGVIGLTIIGSGKTNTGCIGIKHVYTNRAVLRDVDIHGTYRGIWSENVWQDTWDNVHVHGGGSDQNYMGFYMAPKAATVGVSNAVIAIGCVAQGVEKWGYRLENCNGSKFTACEAMDGETAWYIGDPSSGAEGVQFAVFDSCLGDTCSSYTWRIEKGAATVLQEMQFSNCWAGSSGVSNVRVAGGSELTFSNWQVISSAVHGFHFESSSRCSVTGCNIRNYNNTTAANHGVLLQDSLVIALTGNQIYTAFPGTGKAVAETGTADNNIIVANALAWGTTYIGAGSVHVNNVAV